MASKSGIESGIRNSGLLKCLQIKGEVHPKFTYVD